jgi:hypothetical protein
VPVDDLGVQIEAQAIDDLLDVVDGVLGVPPGIDVRRPNFSTAIYARYELSMPPLMPIRQSWSFPTPSRLIASICGAIARSPTSPGFQLGRMLS